MFTTSRPRNTWLQITDRTVNGQDADRIDFVTTTDSLVVNLGDGTSLVQFFDVGSPADDTDAQEARLTTKFLRLAQPVIGDERAAQTVELVGTLDTADTVDALMTAVD